MKNNLFPTMVLAAVIRLDVHSVRATKEASHNPKTFGVFASDPDSR
jgi:hypothetical protein